MSRSYDVSRPVTVHLDRSVYNDVSRPGVGENAPLAPFNVHVTAVAQIARPEWPPLNEVYAAAKR